MTKIERKKESEVDLATFLLAALLKGCPTFRKISFADSTRADLVRFELRLTRTKIGKNSRRNQKLLGLVVSDYCLFLPTTTNICSMLLADVSPVFFNLIIVMMIM